MDSNKLTLEDVDVLLEACEAWVRDSDFGHAMGSLMGGIFFKNDPSSEFKEKETERKREHEDKKRQRKHRCIVLQGKLIAVRDTLVAASIVGSDHDRG